MADEQTPQSDLIDDAIRQAERQLEEKLQALRMSALGEPAPQAHAEVAGHEPDQDAAVLRPSRGSASRTGEDRGRRQRSAPTREPEASATPEQPVAWQEMGGDDVSFAPLGDARTSPAGTDLYVPDQEQPLQDELDESSDSGDDARPADYADDHWKGDDPDSTSLRESLSSSVTDLSPVWDDEDEPSIAHSPTPTTRPRRQSGATSRPAQSPPAPPAPPAPSVPSEDELQFWAHTRTALRNLQQVTDGMSTQVASDVGAEVSRLLDEELSTTQQALHTLQEQLQHTTAEGFPQLVDRVQHTIEQAVASPSNAIQQVRQEIPEQLDRVVSETHDHIREELDRSSTGLHGAVQHDISQLEQSIATNVTRMSQGTHEAVGRVEHDVNALGERVVRFERGMHEGLDSFETRLRTEIERIEENLREQLVEPTETVRKLDAEMPSRFGRVERALVEHVQASQRDTTTALSTLVDADREVLDRLATLVDADRETRDRLDSITSAIDEDRARRSEDLEVIIDTVTRGWEGLAGAMTALFEQAEESSRRMAAIEQRLGQALQDIEGAASRTHEEFIRQMRDLKPSPIVVTVSHEDAEVRNTTQGGWVPRENT
jgi:hypothetical protein